MTFVCAIVGPTAVGKSELAERVAQRVDAEIVSADSMQIYCSMDVGTAKPPDHSSPVTYHCIDLVEPGTPYSAALYQAEARSAIKEIVARGRLPILCGGTGLYVRAALDDWVFPGGSVESPERAALEQEAVVLGADRLHKRLAELDPPSADLIHPANVRRTIRALEMVAQGQSYADQAAGFQRRTSVYDARFIGLTMARELLYDRIDQRVDDMLAAGLLSEVTSLLAAGFRDALTAAQAIGYKELVPVIEDHAPLDEAVEAIKRATRRYAKRQLTWFKSDPRIQWIDMTDADLDSVLEDVVRLVESKGPAVTTGVPAPKTWRLDHC
ncbi:MAG: tRNA (adenosine(37)-N6)-dimethylallyltransferase MiaA [Coriobacteriia bacterium]|jgi:tRNA dimethylallyltransferase|nr:tRNA (adenosine(37)-N6)-dimethylallyltransferase MiaA [Coriobacteriia bacterium]